MFVYLKSYVTKTWGPNLLPPPCFSIFPDSRSSIHLLPLPLEFLSSQSACLSWEHHASTGCLGLDNVLLTGLTDIETFIDEQFDPLSIDQWLFLPGGQIQVKILRLK